MEFIVIDDPIQPPRTPMAQAVLEEFVACTRRRLLVQRAERYDLGGAE